MARKKYEYQNIQFDSNQEIEFYQWLAELKNKNFVQSFQYQPKTFILSQRQQWNKKFILRPHQYTPDFKVKFNKQFFQKYFTKIFKINNLEQIFYIDIKGGFLKFQGNSFSINKKWMWQKYNIFIYKIFPFDLFKKTFVPQLARYTLVRKQLKKKYIQLKTIQQFLEK